MYEIDRIKKIEEEETKIKQHKLKQLEDREKLL